MINIAEMPKYQTYKDSTEGWIGDVPEHWDIRKLKHLFYEKKHRPNMSLNSGAISFGKVVTKDDEKILLSTKASYQEVLSGEFLINPLNLNYDLISLRIALSEIDVVVSAGYIVIKEKEELQKQYFKYLLHRYDVAYMKLLGSGVRQTISFNHIANSLLVFPPLEEQSLIANYLEKKTAQVDEAIAIKEQQISLLKERKQIIIQHAVTQGLDPNVPMKDSGVDWIGKIPEHWEVRRAKYIFKKENRPVRLEDDVVTCFRDGQVTLRTNRRTEGFTFATKEHGYQGIRKGDLVIHAMDAFAGAIGVSDSDGKSSPVYSACTPVTGVEVNPKYYALYLRNLALGGFIESLAKGIRERSTDFRYKDFSELFFPLPDIETQNKVVLEIEKSHQEIDGGISVLTQQIERIKEYKATLINSAVTGKIKITPEMVEQ
ncbi:restriction endonuclease subunit S [Vibrio cholerae]|uniref:restriction endonuclease subunit S n=1 Tax=Vibrio TaxID=662 RepID=UPI0018FE78DD|nr:MULTISPECIES: restriction endonuclease subunit S [Vibrio]MCZ6276099.1 restriction endonuclease subunit S [Vibrio parahaemolyticus]